jgi:hypothetical protein
MEPQDLFPGILVPARAGADAVNADSIRAYARPLTGQAMAHLLRSHAMGEFDLLEQDRFTMEAAYQSSGRIRITDHQSGDTYQLKSAAALGLDTVAHPAPQLFAPPALKLVIYSFDQTGVLTLFCAAAHEVKIGQKKVFRLQEEAIKWGAWKIDEWVPGATKPFDQRANDFDWSEYFGDGFDDVTNADGY